MKKIIFILIIVAVCLVLLFVATKQYESKQKPAEKQKITVLLDWFPNTNHTGLYVALEKGYFEEESLDVKIIQPSEGDGAALIASKKADFAISSQESVTLARVKDIPIVSIAAIIQHNTSAFASLKTSNIKSPKDFEGKRYGGWGSPIENTTIQALMTDAGADYKSVQNVTIGTTDFFTSIGKDNDFQWIFYGWDGVEAKRRGMDLNLIMLKDLDPILDYYTPVIITSEDNIKEKKEMVAAFMRATARGYTFSIEKPQDAAAILLESAPELSPDLVKASQFWLQKQYQADADRWGVQKVEVWKRYADWLYEHKLMEKNIDVQAAFTNEFIPQ